MACLVDEEYEGPEILHKIVNADLLITEEIKTINSSGQHRFAFKFSPLPLHPNVYQKKGEADKKKKKNDENKHAEEEAKQSHIYQRKDGVQLHNAMAVCFHPFMIGFDANSGQVGDGGKKDQIWYKAMLLPLLLSYFEKSCYLKDINCELFSQEVSPLEKQLLGRSRLNQAESKKPSGNSSQASFLKYYVKPGEQLISKQARHSRIENNVLPEYLSWAVSAGGITSSRQTFETLESYGDTILKLAATLLAYEWKKDDKKAGEGDIENMKVAFITNFHLFRIGFNLKLQRYIKTLKDPDSKDWVMPLTQRSLEQEQVFTNKCIGKAISDCVEALIGALYLSSTNPYREAQTGETGLYRAMKWLSDIKCVPLETGGILNSIK